MKDTDLTSVRRIDRKEMHRFGNYLAQGLFQAAYAVVKNNSLPLFNILRYLIAAIFFKSLQSTAIGEGVTFWFPWNIRIGKKTSINQGCILDGTGGLTIGNDVRIAPYVVINTVDHEFRERNIPIREQGFTAAPILIEDDVWIGASVVVNKGVTIGKGSVIGAGSVVTRSIPPNSIAVGVPCRVIKER